MSGPWEKYAQAQPSQSNDGPWSKYQKPSGPSESESGIRGAISGFTASMDDEITGGLGAVGRVFGVKNLGSAKPFDPNSHYEIASEPLSVDEIVKAYRENRDAIRDEQKLDMATNPKATIAGNLAGAIVSPVGKLKAAKGANALTTAMKTGAVQGAAYGAGASDSDLTKGEVGQFAKDTAMGAGVGAAIPPSIKVAGASLNAGANAAKWAGKKAFTGVFGVSESNVSKYLANPERINNAASLGEIKDLVDESVGKLRDAVEQGKATESDAKEALRTIKDQVTRGLSDKKVDAKDALRASESLFEGARERVLAPLKAKLAPTDRATDVASMVGDLKQKVIDQSKQALSYLKPGDRVDLSKVYNSIDESLDRLKSAGTDEADAIAGKLQDYKTRIMSKHWAQMDAQEAKKLIQGLDEITSYSPMAGAFDQAKNKAFKGVRSALDQSLKEGSREYEAAMQPVAKNAQLLDEANSAFGSPEVAVGKLGRLNTPRGQFDRETLAQLEQATGKNGLVTKEADAYATAQRILKDPQAVQKIEQGLPEYQIYRKAMADVAKRNPKWTRVQIEQATAAQRRALAEATGKRIFSEKQLAPLKSLSPSTTENRITSVMRGEDKGFNNRELLDRIGKNSGNDFLQMADDLSIKNSFEKGATNGSRNTVMGAVVGFIFGGIYGAGAGATIGHTVIDRYGPKVGKSILDGIIKIKNNPSIQTIRSLSLPEGVKSDLEREFMVYMQMKDSPAPMRQVAGSNSEPKGESLWIQNGADKLGIDPNTITSKEGRSLLIEASDLPANSKKLQTIKTKLQGLK